MADNVRRHFMQFTSKQLSEFVKVRIPTQKGLYKMKKNDKANILVELVKRKKIKTDDYVYVKPDRSREYGISKGRVKPYTADEQNAFNNYYDEPHPLKSKQLDPKKHKIAHASGVNITLQDHQKKFILSFINDFIQGALLFHNVGSGKTLTAVAFSHYYLALHPTHNVTIISPPSLLFNFVQGMQQYGLDIRDNRYKFESYLRFIKDTPSYVDDKTLLIIDEAHYFRTMITEPKMIKNPKTGKSKMSNGKNHAGRKIIEACGKAHKILAMTGTPFINTLYDIENIMSMIGKKQPLDNNTFYNLIKSNDNLKDYFDYRVSYFNIMDTDDKKYFPTVFYKYVPIEINEKHAKIYNSVFRGNVSDVYNKLKDNDHDNLIKNLIQSRKDNKEPRDNKSDDDDSEDDIDDGLKSDKALKAYYGTSRQLSDMINNAKIKYVIDLIKANPKTNIIVYSVFMEKCLNLVKKQLQQEHISYVFIDGSIDAKTRQKNLERFNDINNDVCVMLISKAGTEGVSTKRTRHIVIMESAFNMALTEQAVARAVRFKSHYELPEKERNVTVHRLTLCTDENDIKHVNYLNSGKYDEKSILIDDIMSKKKKLIPIIYKYASAILIQNDTDRKLLSNIEDRYREAETIEQMKEHKKTRPGIGRKKTPFLFSDSRFYFHILHHIKKDTDYNKLKGDKKFNRLMKKLDDLDTRFSKINCGKQDLVYSNSTDIILEYISLYKKHEIQNFVNKMYVGKDKLAKSVEEHSDDTTQKLNKALEIDDPKKVIAEQQKILQNRKNDFLKLSDKVERLANEAKITKENKLNAINRRKDTAEASQEFHTPMVIANELMSYSQNIKNKGLRVLEPTAGYGSLVKSFVETSTNNDYVVEMIEYNEESRKILELYCNTLPDNLSLQETKNFLEYIPNESYDIIIMNPPFHLKKTLTNYDRDYWDSDFVLKAYDMLKKGGEILAITSPMLIKHAGKLWKGSIKKNTTLLKEYKEYKWQGEKGGNLRLNFNMYRVTK